ncbi:uncharacterized protein LOC129888994 isoform X4 [Solanum dulcamara]|uniref:uncharacterized protein LOC129888994 isoform X4 n=1 Tax=Solanum dulcamara TaxID=45834 RepID=UPI0024854DF3|nr:uncharacterized protein LOC129888994 isoform X4 [Solanum dulcamara]
MRTHLSTCYGLLSNALPLTFPLSRLTMARSNTSNPNVDKLQQLLHSDPSGGWDKCWEKGVTPWDLGQTAPILVHLHQTGALPKGRALVPGCGSGHDVVAIACPERFVVGLDVSENAIKQATKLRRSLASNGDQGRVDCGESLGYSTSERKREAGKVEKVHMQILALNVISPLQWHTQDFSQVIFIFKKSEQITNHYIGILLIVLIKHNSFVNYYSSPG